MIKSIKQLSILFILLSLTLSSFSQGFGEQILINDGWSFHLGDLKYGGRESLDHSDWRKLDLPHDWSVEGIASPDLSSCTGYLPGGIAWYRKNLEIPANKEGQKVYIYFEGVYNNSEVFINGKWLGKRPNGYISFMYDMTPYINFGGKNVVAVRVDHSDDADSRWYTGSGIYRDVHLIYANPVHIDLWGVYYNATIKGSKATINITTNILNETEKATNVSISQTLLGADGQQVATLTEKTSVKDKTTFKQGLSITNPQLWSIERPYLYTLETTVKQGNKLLDKTTTVVGLRTLAFDANTGFALNGKSTKFKGVCIHHDAGCLGSAVPKTVWRRRLVELKKLGCNAIRMSHNPQATDVYDLCDELGFIVMDEAFDEWEYPKKKWISGWNVGTPGFQGSAQYFREWSERDLGDMIKRDRNHPSIIMWSIGNEVDYPNDPYSHPIMDKADIGQIHVKGYQTSQPNAERLGEIATALVKVVKQYDTSRPTTAALAGAVMSNYTDYPFVLDVVGYNYTENRYEMDHKKYPKRVLYGSENSRDYNAWRAVSDNDFIMGQFLWTGFDYLGEAGPWPSRGFTTGLIDLAGYPKPQAYFRQSLWSDEPMVYIGSYCEPNKERQASMHAPAVWNYNNGDEVRVVCYTNGDEAELLLNGKTIGDRTKKDDKTGMIYWDISYTEGTLEVQAYKDGQAHAYYAVSSVTSPKSIVTKSDISSFSKKGAVAQIEISIVDEEGRLVPFADTQLYFQLSKNLRLLGTENGASDPTDNYKDNVQRCHNGRLLLYIQCLNPDEKAQVKISAPLFKNVSIIL